MHIPWNLHICRKWSENIVVWRQMPKLTALLQCCIATSLHPKSVRTESTLRYFAASLQSMPAWKQHISRCFVASLQSYIRYQSELKAASATSLLRCFVTIYASLNTRPLSLLRCFAAILYKMPVRTEGNLCSLRYFAASLQSMPASEIRLETRSRQYFTHHFICHAFSKWGEITCAEIKYFRKNPKQWCTLSSPNSFFTSKENCNIALIFNK